MPWPGDCACGVYLSKAEGQTGQQAQARLRDLDHVPLACDVLGQPRSVPFHSTELGQILTADFKTQKTGLCKI